MKSKKTPNISKHQILKMKSKKTPYMSIEKHSKSWTKAKKKCIIYYFKFNLY